MSSAPHSHAPTDAHNEDGVNMGKIVAVGVISLVIFAISALVASLILDHDTAMLHEANGVPVRPAALGQAEIGIVDQVEFASDRRLDEWRKERHEWLTTYGWADRSKGLIHIPIDKAIDELVGAQP
jgi:hypothetical protein